MSQPDALIAVLIVFALTIVWQAYLNKNIDYQCDKCGNKFSISAIKGALTPHSMGKKLVTCPKCGARTWTKPVRKDQ